MSPILGVAQPIGAESRRRRLHHLGARLPHLRRNVRPGANSGRYRRPGRASESQGVVDATGFARIRAEKR